jgi:SSS family solute:Na+ symporter
LQQVQSLLAPGIAAVFLLGIISKRTSPKAGYYGLLIGFAIGMLRLALIIAYGSSQPEGDIIYTLIVAPNWLHYEVVIFFIIILAMIIISAVTPAADPIKIQGLYLGSATPEQKALTKASYSNWDLIHSGVIIAAVIAFYAYFW